MKLFIKWVQVGDNILYYVFYDLEFIKYIIIVLIHFPTMPNIVCSGCKHTFPLNCLPVYNLYMGGVTT